MSSPANRDVGAVQLWNDPVRVDSPELAKLIARVAVGASEHERRREPPFAAMQLVKEAGLGRLRIPVEEAGAGATLPELFSVLIDLAAADSNLAQALQLHFAFVEGQLQNPDPVTRGEAFAFVNHGRIVAGAHSGQAKSPVDDGSEARLTPSPDGSGYVLNGVRFYSTGSIYADMINVTALSSEGLLVMVSVPADRDGVVIEDDWEGFGQTLTGTGTTRLENVRVAEGEWTDMRAPSDPLRPGYLFPFLQLFLQAVTAGILRRVRDDAVVLVKRQRGNLTHAYGQSPAADPHVLQVVGQISADAFAAEAIVLTAAGRLQMAFEAVSLDPGDLSPVYDAQVAAAQAKVAIDSFAYKTASALFDRGGPSATQSMYNLDRHWRNVRTISACNPASLQATALGDFYVNGATLSANGAF